MTTLSRIVLSLLLLAASSLALSAADGLIVFSARDDSGYFHLYSVRPDGSGLKRLSFGKNDDTSVALSWDAERILFQRRVGTVEKHYSLLAANLHTVQPSDPSTESPPASHAPSGRYCFYLENGRYSVIRAGTPTRSTELVKMPSGFTPLLWLDDDRLFGAVTEAEHTQYAMWDLRENALRAYRTPEYAPNRSYIRVPAMLQYLVMAEYDAKSDNFVYEWLDVNKGKKMDFVKGKSLSFANDGKGSHCFIAPDGRLMAAIGRLGAVKAISPKAWRVDSCVWLP